MLALLSPLHDLHISLRAFLRESERENPLLQIQHRFTLWVTGKNAPQSMHTHTFVLSRCAFRFLMRLSLAARLHLAPQ